MIDDNFQILKEEAKIYPPLPKNVYQVELLDITLKDAKGQYAKPGDKNFSFQFVLLAGEEANKDESGNEVIESLRGRSVWDNFVDTTLFIGKKGKNSLYQIVETYLERELTREEEAKGLTGAFLKSFIGKQIKVFIDQVPSKKDSNIIYNNITSYIKADSQLTPLTEEEKENSKVKNKEEDTVAEPTAPTSGEPLDENGNPLFPEPHVEQPVPQL